MTADRQTTPARPAEAGRAVNTLREIIVTRADNEGDAALLNSVLDAALAEARSIPVAELDVEQLASLEEFIDGIQRIATRRADERAAPSDEFAAIAWQAKEARRVLARLASPVVRTEQVIERLDRPGNRADGVRTEGHDE